MNKLAKQGPLVMYKGIFAVALALWAGNASSAAFNCSQQSLGTVEKMICADAQLSGLDEQLARLYNAALDAKAADKAALKVEQNRWLRTRDLCSDAACLAAAYRERIAALGKVSAAVAKVSDSTYVDRELAYQFSSCAAANYSYLLQIERFRGSDYYVSRQRDRMIVLATLYSDYDYAWSTTQALVDKNDSIVSGGFSQPELDARNVKCEHLVELHEAYIQAHFYAAYKTVHRYLDQ